MKPFLERLQAFWAARQPRERIFLVALVVFVGAALLAQLLWSSHQARARLGGQIPQLQRQLEVLRRESAELQQIKSQPSAPAPAEGSALLNAAAAAAEVAGLPQAGAQMKLESPRRVRLHATLAFDRWVRLIAALQLDAQIRLVSCRVEASGVPGAARIDALFALPEPS